MDKNQRNQLKVEDPLLRVWIHHTVSFDLISRYNVKAEIDDKNIILIGTQENNYKGVQKVLNLKEKKKVIALQTQEEKNKLNHLQNKIEFVNVQTLKQANPSVSQYLDEKFKCLAVYDKSIEMNVRECLQDILTQSHQLKFDEVLILLFSKVQSKGKQKYNCDVKMIQIGCSYLLSIKGVPSSVKDCLIFIQSKIKKNKIKILYSQKTKFYSKIQINFLKQRLKSKNFFTIDNQKISILCESLKFTHFKEQFNDLVSKHGLFLGAMYENSKEQEVDKIVEKFIKQCLYPKMIPDSQLQYKQPKYPNYFNNQGYQQNIGTYNSTSLQQSPLRKIKRNKLQQFEQYSQFPITKYIYYGLQKFTNFKKKLIDIQETFQITINPQIYQKEDKTQYYCLKFLKTRDQLKVIADLKFFFDNYKPKSMIASINSVVNIVQIRRAINKSVDNEQQFKDIIVNDINIKNGYINFELFSAKPTIVNEIVKTLEKLFTNLTKQPIKILPK